MRAAKSASRQNEDDETDEVIASTLTFIGSVTPVTFLGATPVFIDADRSTWNMDPELLEQELEACRKKGTLPKAVIPTDLYGQCADYGRILPICEKYGVPVVADAAEALGARYKSEQRAVHSKQSGKTSQDTSFKIQTKKSSWHHAGYGAKAAIFSFNGNKIITTSGGGMLVSEDKELIDKARYLTASSLKPFPVIGGPSRNLSVIL